MSGPLGKSQDDPAATRLVHTSSAASGPTARPALLVSARREIADRRTRNRHFPENIFGEPAWEILLWLYAYDARRWTIGGLAEHLQLPISSTVRWIGYLQDKKLVRRRPHPTDLRVVFVELTAEGAQAMDAYCSEVLSQKS